MEKILLILPFQLRAESSPFVAGKDWFPLPAWSGRGAWGPSLRRITLTSGEKAPLNGSYSYSFEAF